MQDVRFKLGGLERRVTTPLGLAVDIEAATGVGILALTTRVARGEAPLLHVVEILRLALERSAVVYTSDEILEQIEKYEGIVAAQTAAARVLNGLFYKTPQKAGKASGNGVAATAAAPTTTQ